MKSTKTEYIFSLQSYTNIKKYIYVNEMCWGFVQVLVQVSINNKCAQIKKNKKLKKSWVPQWFLILPGLAERYVFPNF